MTLFQSVTSVRLAALALAMLFINNSNAAAAGPVAKATFEGDYAAAYGADATGCLWFYVSVGRSGTKAAPQTWLDYQLYDVCTQAWIAYGSGIIPNGAFKVTGRKAALNFTASSSALFYTEGPTGVIALTLTADGNYVEMFSGHATHIYPGATVKSHGTWSSMTAQGSVTVLSSTFATAQGSIGESKDKQIQVERIPK